MLAKGLQVALIASPILLSAAPSHAVSLTRTFTGFTDAFAQGNSNWTVVTGGGSAANFTPTSLGLVRPGAAGASPSVSYLLDPTIFETTYVPVTANGRAVKFLGGQVSYTWSWLSTSPSAAAGGYNFQATENYVSVNPEFNPASGTTATGTYTGNALPAYGSFGFIHTRSAPNTTGNATGTISNFQFIAQYETVPGPLPLAGAAAAFAWSRRLRRRLKTAQASI
jgi:hypothetical protein